MRELEKSLHKCHVVDNLLVLVIEHLFVHHKIMMIQLVVFQQLVTFDTYQVLLKRKFFFKN